MSSCAAVSWGPSRNPVMEPHSAGPVQLRFSPYAFNGGTILAIAGEDFSIVASDTRLSEGFSIHSRDSPKCYKLTDKTVIGCSGFHGDCLTLTKIIEARLKMYKHSNNKAMTTGAIAAMLSTILYSRRFFPYYVYNIIGGLDEEGKGAVYSFDPVGSYQRDSFKAGGSASAMLQPLLDNQEGLRPPGAAPCPLAAAGLLSRTEPGSRASLSFRFPPPSPLFRLSDPSAFLRMKDPTARVNFS
ncbi:proteasome 20S subunit beta 1 [Phyllostomus discolor]|uniref:Proteasome subunit beta n=1 Tax=Phyllostomus discolor TaxID=89673 RepID=A0A833YEG7_9CHIR|nr:proteasome 20S subunit beta 1 [Phyllostomus discolor]